MPTSYTAAEMTRLLYIEVLASSSLCNIEEQGHLCKNSEVLQKLKDAESDSCGGTDANEQTIPT